MSEYEPEKAYPAPISSLKGAENIYIQTMAIALALLPFIGYVAPRSLAFLPALVGLMGFFAGWYIFKNRPSLHRGSLYIVLPMLLLAFVSLGWSIDLAESWERILKITPVIFSGVMLLSLMHNYGARLMPLFTQLFPIVALFALAVAFIDLISNGIFYHLMQGAWPNDDFNASALNRGIIVVMLSLIPAYALIINNQDFWSLKRKRLYLALTIPVLFGILLTTDSQSAHLIMALSLIFWVCFPISKVKVWYGLWIVLATLIFASPWIAQAMFNALPDLIDNVAWFQQSYALNRLEIWDYIGRYIEGSPFYGYGIETTRSIEDFDSAYLYDKKATVLHPHNFALQLWIEFGVIGAALGALATGYILRAISRMNGIQARMSLSAFIGLLCPAATAYGMWQGWFIGLFFMITAFCLLAMQKPERAI